jgi:hypothetical protein
MSEIICEKMDAQLFYSLLNQLIQKKMISHLDMIDRQTLTFAYVGARES